MSSGYRKLGCPHLGILALIASAGLALGDTPANPYQPIFERNVFALHDPPQPISVNPTNAPPPPLAAKVILTGIINVGGPKKALLEITETEGGKPTIKKPILREGEREGAVEVLSINFEKGNVLARIGGVESTLNFQEQKSGGAGVAGAAPGRPTPLPVPALPTAPPSMPPGVDMPRPMASVQPNIISRTPVGTPVDRSGVGLYGGTPMLGGTPATYNSGASSINPAGITPADNGIASTINASRNPRASVPSANNTVINMITDHAIMQEATERAAATPPIQNGKPNKFRDLPPDPGPPMPFIFDGMDEP